MSYETVAVNSKNLARKYVNEGNFGRAFSHYLVALQLNPYWREQFKEEFSTVLCKWGTTLDEKKRYSDLFTCYEQALEIFPNDVIILNNLGAHLLRCNLLKEAAYYFRKCINIDRYFIRAAHNLESVANLAIERWHFRMLNDEHRNEAFREAILKKVRKGFHTVLDIGTGTGILSLFCAEGKAKEIYACDSSLIMCEIAERVFLSNNAHNIELIPKHSTEIIVAKDIPQKVSLLVTETFDAALLGEDILHTLSHAWQHLLLPPLPTTTTTTTANLNPTFGLVLPFGSVLYITGIEFEPTANDLHLKKTANSLLLEDSNVFRNCDNYDTQDLSRCRFKCLTATEKLLELNFNDPSTFTEVLEGGPKEIILPCIASGRLDCFAVWFDLLLDEDIVLSTGPLSKDNTAWDQAVFPIPRSILVQQQQNITLSVAFENGKLNINLTNDSEGYELSESAIKILRDDKLGKVLQETGWKLSQMYNGSMNVLDCYPFPVFGLNLLLSRKSRKLCDKLCCFAATEDERLLIDFLAEKFGIEVEVLVKTESDLESFREKEFDVILLDLVEGSGEIKDGVLLEFNHLKSLLRPNGIILPKHVTVMGQFIHSEWLSKASKVTGDSVTCGYNIAEFINVYQVQHFIDLDLKTLDKIVCTDPFELLDLLDLSESVTEKTVPLRLAAPTYANALAYWLDIRFMEGCDKILTSEDSYHHQAAFLFSKNEFVETIKFNIIRNNGLFNIELLKT